MIDDWLTHRATRAVTKALVTAALLMPAQGALAGVAEDNIRFSRLSLDQGLSQSSVNCITQDSQGMMWFGTQDGLNRFDGYTFTVFKHDPLEPGSLSHNFIWALHLARDGSLWIGTEGGGLERWNPTDDSFIHYRHDPSDPRTIGSDVVRSIAEDRQGLLWVGTEAGISRLNPESGIFTHLRHDEARADSLSHDQVRSVFIDSRGRTWIGTEGGGLNLWHPDSRGFTHYRHDPLLPHSLSNDRVRSIHEDRRGFIWVGGYEGGLSRLDPDAGRFTRYMNDPQDGASLSHDRVRALFVDSESTLWVGTDQGLNRWLPTEERFIVYRHNPADPFSLSNDRVLSLFQDRGGLLWVATQAGLNHWNPTLGSFTHFKQDGQAASTLSSNLITALSQEKSGDIWIGTYGGGLDLLDREKQSYSHYRNDPSDPYSLSDDRVMSLLLDSRGDLWVGTLEGGLNRMVQGTGRFEVFRHDPDDPHSLSANGVTSLHEDRGGILWVGTYRGGLNRFDPSSGSFERFRHDPENPGSLSHDRVMVVSSDRKGFIWVGTAGGGLNRLDPRTGAIHRFRHDPENPASLSSDVVWTIRESRDGVLWIGTQAGGLNRWDPERRRALEPVFRVYTERDGLPNAFIYGILEDGEGKLWLSSNKGISMFDPRSETFVNYDTTHGLQSGEFNFGAYHRGPQGEMLFGGNNGFNLFHPSRIQQNLYVPPVVITGINKFNERVVLDRPVWDVAMIELGHRDDVISFDFAALDFSAPQKNRYAYKLEGFDENWIELGNMRRATYTNLDPGEYLFRVKGSNNDGHWNEEGAAIQVKVLPPPWKTWWAYTLYVLGAIAMFAAYAHAQARKLRRKEEYSHLLEQEVRERTQEIAERNSDLANVNSKLQEASLTDSLTGLRNRRYMLSYMQEEISLVERRYRDMHPVEGTTGSAKAEFLFLMIDLDGFKQVNDTYGHEAGDKVLLALRTALNACCRQSDTLIRWGGDEFLVIGRNVDREAARIVAERIRRAVADMQVDIGFGQSAAVGCSIGYAFYPFVPSRPAMVPWEKVLTVADRALYIAKGSGRDAWVGITSAAVSDDPQLVREILESPARQAGRGAIEVHSNRELSSLLEGVA
jgi:diguanylate cyclase (GGDEF)-like protein